MNAEVVVQRDSQVVAFEQSNRDRFWSARCLMEVFAVLGLPKTMLDVGCGPGHLVKIAAALGIDSWGVDKNAQPDENFERARVFKADVTSDEIHGSHDLVLCWEVAEHLPPESADTLCDTLAAVVAPGGWLVFTAATPGQGGSGHLNEQPHGYWRDKLTARGLRFEQWYTDHLRDAFRPVAHGAWWYGKNVQVFRRAADEEVKR